ncbi:MAG: serine hydrolase [Bacteroidetes bacterium 4572_112]|nr:MAG: serine hydrolase [Bacteroidetes bacterium 4572_112]
MTKKQIKRILKIVFIIASISSLWLVPWILVKAWVLPLPDTVQEQVNEAIGNGFDGMIVYVDEAGKSPVFYTGGWKDRKNKIPADPKSLFKIASISKLYNAVAIAKLVNDKRLDLNKTLADYFPELVGRIENSEKITLRMMVQHRSGIPNYTNYPNFWENPPESREETLELALDLPANFEPNEDYGYSNTNYLLIGALIDKILGYSHQQYIKEKILIPLRLNNTFFSLSEVNIDEVMSGYHVGHPYDLKTDENGMLASVEDVGIFLRALNNGSVFEDGEQTIYSSIYEYGHSGWVPGYQSFAEYHKDIDAVIVQFNNTTDAKLYMWNLAEIEYNRIVKIIRNNKSP